ncbi:hypothetical protein [Natrinema pallidum]|uniref:Uncharacterized protein n=1 Tax=Natrinema pallidum TaxID=69527 RepID=A0A4P9TM49_9EURY|nr:hypothetical protein [Natrinema pallidum]QCW05305.1 hypothetical protein FGF80_18870 [Natrinema pallidum]
MNGRYAAAGSTRTNEYPYLEQIHGEDPARFLETNELMATGRIAGIRDAAVLEAYEYVADQITAGSYRTTILEAIDKRKAALELDDEPADPTPETTPDPVPATDGGETITEQTATREEIEAHENDHDEPHPVFEVPHTPARVPVKRDDSDEPDVHPDARGVDAGQVLVIEFSRATEYLFPAEPSADDPYCVVGTDGAGEYQDTLTLGEAAAKLDGDLEPKPIDAVDVEPPADAATNGGDA